LIKDELDLDGKPNLNLASFVNTFMETRADQLMMENISKNLADSDEYPALMALHTRCVSIIANMWNIPKGETAIGSATTGSSEAIHLGGLAMKRLWREKREAAGKDFSRPNILMGANAQVALEKFARYFEVEARIIPVSEKSHYCMDADLIRENIDENTIGVFVIMGSTYTGHYEPVEKVSKILDEYEKETGHDIPIHVDAASGGFVAPFLGNAGKKWDFSLPRVRSINVSGHKYGLVYPGVGWIIWRGEKYLPKYLIFELHYLGGTEETYTLNFSRPGAHVIAQYFNFVHFGRSGYKSIMENAMSNARMLSIALESTGWYRCVSDIHRPLGTFAPKTEKPDPASHHGSTGDLSSLSNDFKTKLEGVFTDNEFNPGLPVVSFRFSDAFKKEYPAIQQSNVSLLLRAKGYIIPNYTLPHKLESIEILRVVIRESMTGSLLENLITDILNVTERLMSVNENFPPELAAQITPTPGRMNRMEKVFQRLGVVSTGEHEGIEDAHKAKEGKHAYWDLRFPKTGYRSTC